MEANVLMNGQITGTKRPVRGMENIGLYEVWNGKDWVSEETWKIEQEMNNKEWTDNFVQECDGCNDPFCDCNSRSEAAKALYKIKSLMKLKQKIDKEILSLLEVVGGEVIE
ncbi:hypothetical protein [Paenibacillus thermotolerans]|uniref:hypothetical protein n=1 Tax=Paenibacillus thermotolerans TaxID=3027807 RepID=UPI002367D1B0|nr:MULTISPECIES: hypothetical protein [unclassified Paenibacillus]